MFIISLRSRVMPPRVGADQLATALAARGSGSPLDRSLSVIQFNSQLGNMAVKANTWAARVPGSFYDYVDRTGATVETCVELMRWPKALVEDPVVSSTFDLKPYKCVPAALGRFSALTVYSRARNQSSKPRGAWACVLCATPG